MFYELVHLLLVLECGVIKPASLQLQPATSMEVHVTDVSGPEKFTVQPVGSDLVSLMEDIGYVQ